jgi:hypothetical protein
MMAAAFFGGFIVGAAVLILIALWLATRSTPAKTQANGISACSVTMGGNQTDAAVQCDKELLTKILRAYGADRYFELPDQNMRH